MAQYRDMSNTEQIKFQQNAIVVNGARIRVHYSFCKAGQHRRTGAAGISIYARDYSGRLPASLNPSNDTDLYTDYFEKDRAFVPVSSPLFASVAKAARAKLVGSIGRADKAGRTVSAEYHRKELADLDAVFATGVERVRAPAVTAKIVTATDTLAALDAACALIEANRPALDKQGEAMAHMISILDN